MQQHEPDYGTSPKTLSIYTIGFISCALLTLLAFWTVLSQKFSPLETIIIIYIAACVQFIVQLVCFLRLNTKTVQGKNNVMSLIFTGIILITIVAGSLWIMYSLGYNMDH